MPSALQGLAGAAENMAAFMAARRESDANAERLIRGRFRDIYVEEAGRRTRAQIETDEPLVERLVTFWSNHFTVSVQRPTLFGLAGAFEREAIRPHVAGGFRAMLGAVTRHPAMLVYLDNAQSIGPGSPAGQRRNRGLNENLARELMELHTLGVDGGYSQDDVRALAKILTGWSLGRPEGRGENAGAYMFRPQIHEPGAKTLLGRRIDAAGEAEGEAALDLLARHPTTARHIATKLARHFIADAPPEAAVRRIERAFRDSGGDLAVVTRAVIEAPEAWATPLSKIKSTHDYVVSALRTIAYAEDGQRLLGALRLLGQAPFAAPSPQGWPDSAEAWIGPESVVRRAEWALALGGRIGDRIRADVILERAIGPVASPATRNGVAHAGSNAEAIALVFAAPEFMRR